MVQSRDSPGPDGIPFPPTPCGSGVPFRGAQASPSTSVMKLYVGLKRPCQSLLGAHTFAVPHMLKKHTPHTHCTHKHTHPQPAHIPDTHIPICTHQGHPQVYTCAPQVYTHIIDFPPTTTHSTRAHCTDTHHTHPCRYAGAHVLQIPTASHT